MLLLSTLRTFARLVGMRLGLVRQPKPVAQVEPTYTFAHPPEDLTLCTLGQLYQAAQNVDILFTTATEQRLSERDRQYLLDRSRAIDAELRRRGYAPYMLED